ncbi:MAG TPA: glycosyltransferase family 39 protein [Negativicutes bacterium]|nr:glycosyltransferase family 39 protein [Negativicutes bacterium]
MDRNWRLPLLLIAAALLMLTWLTDSRIFYHDDEWLYMKIAEEMFDRGEYWIPLWLGEPAYYKPPMAYWMMMVFFPFGGDRLLLARLSIALTSMGTLVCLYLLAKSLYRSSESGLRAGLFAVTSLGFLAFGKIGMLEMPMAFFMTAAMLCFAHAWMDRSSVWAGFFLAITGGSALTKGPITVLALGLTAFLLLLFYGRWRPFFSRPAFFGSIAGLFFIGLWPLALYFKGEFPRWFAFFIIGENFGKFADAVQYPIGPFLSYLPQWCLPWTFLPVAALLWLFLRGRRLEFEYGLPILWAASVIAIHLLPDTKLAWYMFLPVPACMLLVAGVYTQARRSKVLIAGCILTQIIFGVLGIVALVLAWFLGFTQPVGLLLTGATIAFAFALCVIWQNRLTLTGLSCLVAFACLISAGATISPPHLPPASVVALASRHAEVTVMRKQMYLYTYAFNKKVRQIISPDEVVNVLDRNGLVIIGEKDLGKTQQEYPFFAQKYTATPHYKQWLEELPPDLIRQALLTGDLSVLQENVYAVTGK